MGFYNPIYKNEFFFSSKTHISTPFAQDIYMAFHLLTWTYFNDVDGGRNILINSQLKVSEYLFKQNVKKHDSAITYIVFNISLDVLRPSFFNICNLPFLSSPNFSKIRVKVGPKTNYFSYVMSSCTNRIAVFNNFFHWYVANQETNKTVPAIF